MRLGDYLQRLAAARSPAAAPQPAQAGSSLPELIASTAQVLGIPPADLATVISYETGGTFDPMQPGPTTQWGQHRGFIQFGEPQARQYGADFSSPEAAIRSQLGPDGAIVRYLFDRGYRPGMSLLDLYSTINAGAPGRHNASDANNGGAPGTVADKVRDQFAPHRANAERLLGGAGSDVLVGSGGGDRLGAPPAAPQGNALSGYAPPVQTNALAAYSPPPPPPLGGTQLDGAAFMQAPRNAMSWGFTPGASPFL